MKKFFILSLGFVLLFSVVKGGKAQGLFEQFQSAQDLVSPEPEISEEQKQAQKKQEQREKTSTTKSQGIGIFKYKKTKISRRSPSKIANQYVGSIDKKKLIRTVFKKAKMSAIPKPDEPREKKALMLEFLRVFGESLLFSPKSGFIDEKNTYSYKDNFTTDEKKCSELFLDFSNQNSVHYVEPSYFIKNAKSLSEISNIKDCPIVFENYDKVWGHKKNLRPQYSSIVDVPYSRWTYLDYQDNQRKSFAHWSLSQACKGRVLYDLKDIIGKKGKGKYVFTAEVWEKQDDVINMCKEQVPSETIYYSIIDENKCDEQKIKMLSRFKKYGNSKENHARSLSSNGLAYFQNTVVLYHQFVCNIGEDIESSKCGGLELFVLDSNKEKYKNLSCHLYSR